MDISKAIIAKSDQLNSSDLTGGPQTVVIIDVKEGNADQPVNIITDVFGPGRPFKPSKTVLRVLADAWKSTDTTTWVGHRATLYRDPSVRWAGEEVGGIRVSALSHIDKSFTINLPTSKGKYAKTSVEVLPDTPSVPAPRALENVAAWIDKFTAATTIDELGKAWNEAGKVGATKHADLIAAKDARKAELTQ